MMMNCPANYPGCFGMNLRQKNPDCYPTNRPRRSGSLVSHLNYYYPMGFVPAPRSQSTPRTKRLLPLIVFS